MTTELTEGDLIVGFMKLNPNFKLHDSTTNRTLFWANDKKQWEVYSFDRYPTWHYKGNDLFVALSMLKETK